MKEGTDYARTLVLHILTVLHWSYNGLAQSDVTTGWTFSPGGYVAFKPNLTVNDDQRIGVSFRTKEPHGLLFCHILKEYNRTEFPLLENYRFCAELYQGYIQVSYVFNRYSDIVKLGKGKENIFYVYTHVYFILYKNFTHIFATCHCVVVYVLYFWVLSLTTWH